MCGIAGEVRFDNHQASTKTIEHMIDDLKPRGPDGTGMFRNDKVCFGHCRLKIIDLSEASDQPMTDKELGLVIVYNGAIYNYETLREELKGMGYSFFSQGDTEVILKAYHAWGRDCVKHFYGMFAFAILEQKSGKLFAARDKLGIKPFYYQKTENEFRFSSFLPALVKAGQNSPSINPVALNQYMSFRAITEGETIFKDYHKLPAATRMTINPDGSVQQDRYWDIDFSNIEEDRQHSEEYWIDAVKDVLTKAVKRRLTADVPVGVLLSGGLDSSLVVGLLHELGQKDINTFSIGFENVGDESGNEFQYSDVIADRYQTKHHQIFAEQQMLKENLSACIKAMSEPMVSHDVIGFYLLSREVSKHVKVVQSGQGADEVFGGYHWYPPMLEATEENAAKIYAENYFTSNFQDYKKAVKQDLIEEDYAFNLVHDFFKNSKAPTPIDKALHLDTTLMLVDDPVKRVDNMTMDWGLEARVPFLDDELVELAARIPAEYKIKNGGKYVLQEAARRIIPHEVIDRPKGYFPVPALKQMKGAYLEMAKQIFSNSAARNRNIFKADYIQDLLSSPESHITPFGSRVWQATLLEYWLQEHGL
ncbi:MAG: N-acetylglutaminylglutamine amidotransferase [Balneolaceae bacterium]